MDPLASLFVRYRRGDLDALGEVFDRTAPRLLRLAMHLVHSAADAEDLVQATYVQAMRLAATFDAERPLLPWLLALLAGQARNLSRSRRRKAAEPLPELAAESVAPPDAAARAELLAHLRAGVARLSSEQRQVLLLQLQHGLSPAEIADVLEVPAGTVRMRLHRGIQALRSWLPAGLAIWLTSFWPSRGLAAVRGELMAQAAGQTATHVSPTLLALLMKKKLFAVVAAVVAVGSLLWLSTTTPPGPDVGAPTQTSVVGARVDAAADPSPTPSRDLEAARTAAEPQRSSLRVVVRGKDSVPVVDLPVFLWPDGSDGWPGSAVAMARTDAEGHAHFAQLPAGTWSAGPRNAAREVRVEGASTTLVVELRTHRLHGRVVDASSLPVADAVLELTDSAEWIGESHGGSTDLMVRTAARSDADGRFVCTVVAEDEARASSEAYLAARHAQHGASGSHLTRNGFTSELVLRIEAFTAVCAGHVVDPAGQRLAGVLVGASPGDSSILRRADGSWRGRPLPVLTRTDASGRFRLPVTWRGATHVVAQGANSARATRVLANPDAEPVELVLRPARNVAGRVLQVDGRPAAELTVRAQAAASRWEGRTDGAGRFRLEGVLFHELTLTVVDAHGRAHQQPMLAADADASALQIVLPPTVELRGRLVGPDGNGLHGFLVKCVDAGADDRVATTGERGEFELPADQARTAQLAVFAPFAAAAADPLAVFAVTPGQPALLTLEAQAMPRAAVTGRVVDERGAPIVGADVTLWAEPGDEAPRSTRTAADGTFALRHLAAAAVALRIEASAEVRAIVRRFRTEAGDLGDVVLTPSAQLRIRAVHPNGEPWQAMLPDCFVHHVDEPLGVLAQRCADGLVHCVVLPGTVRVELDDPNVIAEPLQAQLAAGEDTTLTLTLRVARRLELQFAAPDEFVVGRPDEPLLVRILDTGGTGDTVREHRVRRGRFDPDRWTLATSLPFGRYRVEATRSDGLAYTGEVEVDDAPERPTSSLVPRVR
jgi:RNA polymerase sigma factor (sigma-70 family)